MGGRKLLIVMGKKAKYFKVQESGRRGQAHKQYVICGSKAEPWTNNENNRMGWIGEKNEED